MNRKLIAIFTALLLTASLCACGDRNNEKDTESGNKINISTEAPISNETENGTGSEGSEDVTVEPIELVFSEKKDTVYVISSTNQVNLRSEPVVTDATARLVVDNGAELQRIAISRTALGAR